MPIDRLVIVSAAAFALVLAGVSPALARHRYPESGPPVQGLVVSAQSTALRLLSAGDIVTYNLDRSTRVVRLVNGSTADFAPNEFVQVHSAGAGNPVTSLEIDNAWLPPYHVEHDGPTRHSGKSASHPGSPSQPTSGLLSGWSRNTVTLHCAGGKSVTYALAASTTITKTVLGGNADLAPGEQVRVYPGRAAALAVEILHA